VLEDAGRRYMKVSAKATEKARLELAKLHGEIEALQRRVEDLESQLCDHAAKTEEIGHRLEAKLQEARRCHGVQILQLENRQKASLEIETKHLRDELATEKLAQQEKIDELGDELETQNFAQQEKIDELETQNLAQQEKIDELETQNLAQQEKIEELGDELQRHVEAQKENNVKFANLEEMMKAVLSKQTVDVGTATEPGT